MNIEQFKNKIKELYGGQEEFNDGNKLIYNLINNYDIYIIYYSLYTKEYLFRCIENFSILEIYNEYDVYFFPDNRAIIRGFPFYIKNIKNIKYFSNDKNLVIRKLNYCNTLK